MKNISIENTSTGQESVNRFSVVGKVKGWLDSESHFVTDSDKISAARLVPFLLLHCSAVSVIWVGVSQAAVWTAIALYLIRMFAITAFYHRYFSHKNFRTSRIIQFIFAFIGASSGQRGPLWWASHHRVHHANTDTEKDPHSPKHLGFWWSHTLWFLSDKNFSCVSEKIKDFSAFPELRWLDRFDWVAPLSLIIVLYLFGEILQAVLPELQTNGWQMVVWGFVISTLVLYHATYTINSLAHRFGTRRFNTNDDSRNNWWLAIITLGEGWHNNHHYYAGTVKQGFRWYEIDCTYYLLKVMSYCGLVYDLKPLPDRLKKMLLESKR